MLRPHSSQKRRLSGDLRAWGSRPTGRALGVVAAATLFFWIATAVLVFALHNAVNYPGGTVTRRQTTLALTPAPTLSLYSTILTQGQIETIYSRYAAAFKLDGRGPRAGACILAGRSDPLTVFVAVRISVQVCDTPQGARIWVTRVYSARWSGTK